MTIERSELEIQYENQTYPEQGNFKIELLGRGYTWLETGTHEFMLEAANFFQTIEKRQGLKVACIEGISFELGFIN